MSQLIKNYMKWHNCTHLTLFMGALIYSRVPQFFLNCCNVYFEINDVPTAFGSIQLAHFFESKIRFWSNVFQFPCKQHVAPGSRFGITNGNRYFCITVYITILHTHTHAQSHNTKNFLFIPVQQSCWDHLVYLCF